jgi:hypothetical protein
MGRSNTAWSLNNIANAMHAQGTLHEHTLVIRETRLGPDHRDMVRSQQHFATVMAALAQRQ